MANELKNRSYPMLILAALAVLGWGLYIYSMRSGVSERGRLREQITHLDTAQERLKLQLTAQEQAAGAIADLQNKIAVATNDLQRTTAEREKGAAELQAMQKEVEAQRQQHSRLASQVEVARAELSKFRAQAQETEKRLAAAREEISGLQQATVARSQELAEVGRRLEIARQREAQARETLAQITQESTVKSAEAAAAEQRIQRPQHRAVPDSVRRLLSDVPPPASAKFSEPAPESGQRH